MCQLCSKYGVWPIEDKVELKQALAEAAREMELQPSSAFHYLDFIDKILDDQDLPSEEDENTDAI
jgi:hypothetical protein